MSICLVGKYLIMKKLKVITTFSQHGYHLYGKKWIESILKYCSADIEIQIYTDFDLPLAQENFLVKDFNKEFPEHNKFILSVTDFFSSTEKNIGIGHKTVKFSYKSFVINRELKNSNGILIWLDGDVETLSKINIQDFKTILNGKFLACQTEKQQYKYPHIESGILIFDCSHPTTKIFQKKFEEYYYSNKILSMKKPYDGYVIGRVLKENDLDFVNLNKNFEIIGKMSTADTTFQHPFLKERFIHRIGQAKHEA